MGRATKIAETSASGGASGAPPPATQPVIVSVQASNQAPDSSGVTSTQIAVRYAPPSDLSSFEGVHAWIENPDFTGVPDPAGTDADTVFTLDDTAVPAPHTRQDLGRFPFVLSDEDAAGNVCVILPLLPAPRDQVQSWRLYLGGYTASWDKLIPLPDPNHTPTAAFTVVPSSFALGEEYAPLVTNVTAVCEQIFYGGAWSNRIKTRWYDPDPALYPDRIALYSGVIVTFEFADGSRVDLPFVAKGIEESDQDWCAIPNPPATIKVWARSVGRSPGDVNSIAKGLTPSATVTTLPAPAVTAISAVEAPGARFQDTSGGGHTVINVDVTVGNGNAPVTLWLWYDDEQGAGYAWHWKGWMDLPSGRATTVPFTVWLPTLSDQTWKAAACSGPVNSTQTLPAGALVSATFSVPRAGACLATDATNIHFLPDPATGSIYRYSINSVGVPTWDWYGIQFTCAGAGADYALKALQLYVQAGNIAGGVFTGLTPPRPVTDWSSATVSGNTYTWHASPTPDWAYDAGATVWRMTVTAVSMQGQGLGGAGTATETLQTGWPGGADHFDLVPRTPGPTLKMPSLDPSTYDATVFGVARDGLFKILATDMSIPKAGTFDNTIFSASTGLLKQIAVDFSLPKPGTFDSTVFSNAGGMFHQTAVDFSIPKAGSFDPNLFNVVASELGSKFTLNLSTEFDTSRGYLRINAIDAGSIATGNLKVGGSAAPQIVVLDGATPANGVGWIGTNNGYSGAWFKSLYVGGTGPGGSPKLYIDGSGNLVMTGTLTGSASTISGTILANKIGAGTLAIGGSASAQVSVLDGSDNPVGWIGTNGGYSGAWFKSLWIGGTDPTTAKIYCDAAGNSYFSGTLSASTISGITILASKIGAGTLAIGGNASAQISVLDGGNNPVGWIGTNSGYAGAWFKSLWIGGSNPGSAKMYCDGTTAYFNGTLGPSAGGSLTIGANQIVSNVLSVGGGGGKPTGLYSYDSTGNLQGWVGCNSSSVYGAWFAKLWIGGSSAGFPSNYNIYCDGTNAWFKGNITSGSTINLVSGSVTVSMDSTNYVRVQDSGMTAYAQMTGTAVVVSGRAATVTISSGGTVTCGAFGLSSALGPASFSMTGLPSSNPGAGTKQFWYDPADGNRVKFAA